MDNNLRSILIRELNNLEEKCERALKDRGPKTLDLILKQNQGAVDSSFEPNESSASLRKCILFMKKTLASTK